VSGAERLEGNILVVEDEPAIRDVVVTALRHDGHTIQEADDGASLADRTGQ
jgi:CheY-like chemotaxis protein